jgi:2-keto-3-deoxy-L-rhamnonate aldolase RhmA
MGDDMAESKQKPRMSFINIIPSPVVTQAVASAGADAVVIDQEHAPVGPESLHAMIASTAGTKCLPFVRVADEQHAETFMKEFCGERMHPSEGGKGKRWSQ